MSQAEDASARAPSRASSTGGTEFHTPSGSIFDGHDTEELSETHAQAAGKQGGLEPPEDIARHSSMLPPELSPAHSSLASFSSPSPSLLALPAEGSASAEPEGPMLNVVPATPLPPVRDVVPSLDDNDLSTESTNPTVGEPTSSHMATESSSSTLAPGTSEDYHQAGILRWANPPDTGRAERLTTSLGDRSRSFHPLPSPADSSQRDEEEEDYSGMFAFNRPPTRKPQPSGSAPSFNGSDSEHHHPGEEDYQPTGLGVPEPHRYDRSNPPPFSGTNNLNNGIFAFGMRRRGETAHTDNSEREMPEIQLDSSHERHRGWSGGMAPSTSYSSDTGLVPCTPESSISGVDGPMARPRTDRSYAMTELTGDMTVPDGKTTWGDGQGGAFKDANDGGDSSYDPDWLEEDSPYAEVRASVSNMDDPDMPALTLRAYVMGLLLSLFTVAVNTYFVFRNPSPRIPATVVQLIAYPIGKFLAWALPVRVWTVPKWMGGWSFSLNPCPFNVKEHTVVVVMATAAINPGYAMYSIVSCELWYKTTYGTGFNILYLLSSQLTGFCMAGVLRRFVIWPASMIWPGVLVSTTFLNVLHADADAGTRGPTRFKFFVVVACGAFAYYWLPGFLFTALSYFSYACWIAPRNVTVNQLFGVSTGLGMGFLTFDWAQISWLGSPLTAPWWAEVNVAIGFVVFYWIITPAIHYTNVWWTQYLPMMSSSGGDRFGSEYNITNIITPDFHLNTTAYAEYSPLYLTAAFSTTYMVAFGLTTSIIVYTLLNHGGRIWKGLRKIKVEEDDLHMKLMYKYPEVPDYWFLSGLVVCFVLGIVTVEVFGTGLPVWGLVIALLVAFTFVLPSAIIFAMTNLEPSFNLIAELIPGYAFQGQPIPGMVFKVFAVQSISECMVYTRDMKLGHYMKIPPRSMFIVQMSAAGISSLVQIAVKNWMFATIPDICTDNQPDLLLCLGPKTNFTATLVWGLIGPARMFNKGAIYNPQLWMLLVGAVLPVIVWLWVKKFPKSILRNCVIPVIFSAANFTPPATGIHFTSFLAVGFVFQFWIRRRAFAWWSKYNYTLSAALDVGTALAVLAIFVCLGIPRVSLNWWGNTVYKKTLDYNGAVSRTVPPGGFGPDTWKV